MLRRNEWRDVADVASAADVSIVRFCKNVGIGNIFCVLYRCFAKMSV